MENEYQIIRLATPNDTEFLCPIEYVYNYLPRQINWLKPQPISLSRLFAVSDEGKLAFIDHEARERHSIRLDTQAAGLPLHTGLGKFRQSRYWKASEQTAKELLELFAQDRRCSEVILQDKRSMASVAGEQLGSGFVHTYSRFPIYSFIEADENRIQLIAQSVIIVFAFDDVWESASLKTIEDYRGDFVARLRGEIPTTATDTPLERRLNAMRQGLLAGDEEGGNGGAEILETLVDFCLHADPPGEEFGSVRDFLDYRWGDAAVSYVFACCKFSVRSKVKEDSPHLRRIFRRIGDQISIVNDLASYEMEKRRFESGSSKAIINIVSAIMKMERVEAVVAKSMAYAWQLCMEQEIVDELEELKRRDELSVEEWKFIDVWLLAASGNLLTSVVMSRYGGEDARIR